MTRIRIELAAALFVLAVASRAPAGAFLPSITRGTIAVNLQPVATGLAAPDYAISPPGDTSHLFVVEQNGLLRVIQNGQLLPTPALDMQSRVAPPLVTSNANDERGFLGLAFDPGFNNPNSVGFRTLYTYNSQPIPTGTSPTYPAPNGATQNYENVISQWKMSSTDPNMVDPTSRREIISFGKNAANHNGGTIAFGPDGYMYLGTGDGGNANDVGPSHVEPGGNAQNLGVALGKMLRIDPRNPALTAGSSDPVSSNGQYRIPASNPFQAAGQVPEIYAYGLRNPYRFSFDGPTGSLIVADVGQNTIEEIDRVTRGGNYGWAVKEGDFLFDRTTGSVGPAPGNRSPGSPAGLIDPISGPLGTLEYDHGDGISITGGFVYHGTAIPELIGKYVFGDLALRGTPVRADGRLFYADLTTGLINEFLLPGFANGVLPNGLTVHGFGQDGNGELYALVTNTPANGTGGIVYEITAVPEPSSLVLLILAVPAMCLVPRLCVRTPAQMLCVTAVVRDAERRHHDVPTQSVGPRYLGNCQHRFLILLCTQSGGLATIPASFALIRELRMGKRLLLILLALAAAPGCCVLSLHPFNWVDASEPSSTQLVASDETSTQLVASQGIPTDVASNTVLVSNTTPPSLHPGG